MPETPTVSIIIPSYNKRAYVAASIESALAQTHTCEVIVVDDGSTDGSLDVVRRYKDRIILESGDNRGGSAARNRGLELSSGEYVQFLDADDVLPKTKIAKQLERLQGAREADIAFCPWSYFHDNGVIDAPSPRRYWRDHEEGLSLLTEMWYLGGFFPPHAWLVSRKLIERVGEWNEALTGDDDGEFYGRMLAAASAAHYCKNAQVYYRDPPAGSVSRSRSLESARSDWLAFEIVSEEILSRRDDLLTQKACLSRARKKAYAWSQFDEIVENAAAYERKLGVNDYSPSLPLWVRLLIGFLGLKPGLKIRAKLRRLWS